MPTMSHNLPEEEIAVVKIPWWGHPVFCTCFGMAIGLVIGVLV